MLKMSLVLPPLKSIGITRIYKNCQKPSTLYLSQKLLQT